MNLHRRAFLAGAGAPILAWGAGCGPHERTPPRERWVSARGDSDGTFGLIAGGREPIEISAPFRGHDLAVHPSRPEQVAMFGRRPGLESMLVDLRAGRIVQRILASPGRRFQGHGFFSPDGARLYTSEADEGTGQGKLGVRETQRYHQIDELDTYGIGPHEVALMPDGATAVVANGGILTRPESGREKLNLDRMDPSLTYVDLASGARISQHRLPEPKSSIRHIAVLDDGTVAVGLQLQREALDHDRVLPLGAIHRPGQPLVYLEDPMGLYAAMNDYVGSAGASDRTRVVGLTSPRGDIAAFWHADSGEIAGFHSFADVSGITASLSGEHFILSSSLGEVRRVDARDPSLLDARWRDRSVRWDNHLVTTLA